MPRVADPNSPGSVKRAVRDRDGQACTKCGIAIQEYRERCDRELDVHRLTPGSVYTVDGCVTLCRACHGPEPRSKPLVRKLRTVKPQQPKVPLYVKIRVSLRQRFEAIAEAHGRKLNAEIERALEAYCDQYAADLPDEEPEASDS